MLQNMKRGMQVAVLAACFAVNAVAQDYPVATNMTDCVALDTSARTNWMGKIIPPGMLNFRNDIGVAASRTNSRSQILRPWLMAS